MHGIIGQLAQDPVRFAIAIVALVALVAIVRCLSGLAFFDRDDRLADSQRNPPSTSIEE